MQRGALPGLAERVMAVVEMALCTAMVVPAIIAVPLTIVATARATPKPVTCDELANQAGRHLRGDLQPFGERSGGEHGQTERQIEMENRRSRRKAALRVRQRVAIACTACGRRECERSSWTEDRGAALRRVSWPAVAQA